MIDPNDAPTASELLESVRDWLNQDVLGSVEGRLRFHTRVAVNVLDMVMRELRLGDEQRSTHLRVLENLGYADDASLAAAVRDGRHDESLGELLAALRPVIEDKLRVANPRYLR